MRKKREDYDKQEPTEAEKRKLLLRENQLKAKEYSKLTRKIAGGSMIGGKKITATSVRGSALSEASSQMNAPITLKQPREER